MDRELYDFVRKSLRYYRGEPKNPFDVRAWDSRERAVEFLKFRLWEAERRCVEGADAWDGILVAAGVEGASLEERAAALRRDMLEGVLEGIHSGAVDFRELLRQMEG